MARSIAGLRAMESDPERRASRERNRIGKLQTDQSRKRVSEWASAQWSERRDEIIAAQNAGKGEQWKSKHRAIGIERMKDMSCPLRLAKEARRKLDDHQVAEIRAATAAGETQRKIATRYGVTPSMISRIATGSRYPRA